MFKWKCPKEDDHILRSIVHDNKHLYISCLQQSEIYRYSFDGKFVDSLKYYARAMEIVNDQLYSLGKENFFIVDLKTNSMIENWNLPKEEEGSVAGGDLKVDQEQIYFTPNLYSHYVYLHSKKGKEIHKFGSKEESNAEGKFNYPRGVTVDEEYLYVCDFWNHRVQVLNKENGKFICQWKNGKRSFLAPRSILLFEHLFYVGDGYGIQVFTKQGKCVQVFGASEKGSGKGEFNGVRNLCIANAKLYIVDYFNKRIQVWS